MKKWSVLLALVLLVIAGYVGAGPWLTIRAIRSAVQEQDAAALARHIDFPALRTNIKAQLMDRLVRTAGVDVQSSVFGAVGVSVASTLVDGAVTTLINPTGLAALIEGRRSWDTLNEFTTPPATTPSATAPPPPDAMRDKPWQDAIQRYESLSRFTVTITGADGDPVVFVLTRTGLQWKLSDIRMPAA